MHVQNHTVAHTHYTPHSCASVCLLLKCYNSVYSFTCTGQFKEPNVRLENDLSLTVHNFGYTYVQGMDGEL